MLGLTTEELASELLLLLPVQLYGRKRIVLLALFLLLFVGPTGTTVVGSHLDRIRNTPATV